MARLQVGDRFPLESLPGPFEGPAVVYFYAADFTAGCEAEARGFNALHPAFEAAGARVVGVSIDSGDSHERFAAACSLGFPLVSDEGGSLTNSLGLMKEYGEHGSFAARVTFLLDEQGVVRRIWEDEDVASHPSDVLDAVRELAPR